MNQRQSTISASINQIQGANLKSKLLTPSLKPAINIGNNNAPSGINDANDHNALVVVFFQLTEKFQELLK